MPHPNPRKGNYHASLQGLLRGLGEVTPGGRSQDQATSNEYRGRKGANASRVEAQELQGGSSCA